MKTAFVFIFFLFLLSCATDKELIRFEFEAEFLVFTNKHISGVSLEDDAAGKKYVNVTFTNKGQELVSEFTQNNLNKTMSIISNSKVLMKDIRIRDKITSKSIAFSFDSDQDAKSFTTMIEGELK